MSNISDPDHVFVGPDLDPNYLQRLSAKFSCSGFFKINFFNKSFSNNRVSNSLDPDQDQQKVAPDLG